MEEYLQIGVITTTHGVRGEVKVYPTTDPERFLSLDRVFLDTGKEKKELHVTGVRFFKQLAIVKFKGIDNINDIERYKGCSLYVTREDAIPLEEDEYYIASRRRISGIFQQINSTAWTITRTAAVRAWSWRRSRCSAPTSR